MGMRLTLLLSALIFLSVTGLPGSVQAAGRDWLVMMRQSEKLVDGANYQQALSLNKEILPLLPAGQIGKKLNVLHSSAVCQMNLKMGNELLETIKQMVALGLAAKRADNLDTDGLLALNEIVSMSERGIPGKYSFEERVRLGQKLNEQVLLLCKAVFPEKITAERLDSMARSYIAAGDDKGAERALKTVLEKADRKKPIYDVAEAQLAALQKRLGHPQQFEKLSKERKDKYGFVEGTRRMSDGEMWVADYKACNASLDKCIDYLKKHPNDEELLRCMHARYVVVMDATGKADKGVVPMREAVAVADRLRKAKKTKAAEDEYRYFCGVLAETLKEQGPAHFKEAENWKDRSREPGLAEKTAREKKDLQKEIFLTEKEMRDLEKYKGKP